MRLAIGTEMWEPVRTKATTAAGWFALRTWQSRIMVLSLVLGPAWLADEWVTNWNVRQLKIAAIEDTRDVARQFGEVAGILWIGIILWCVDRVRRRPLLITLLIALTAGGLGSASKLLWGRERPKVSQGLTVFRGPQWPGQMQPDPSFPSGHTVAAFAFAYGLSQLYSRHRAVFVFLAAACGLSRVLGEAHFLTDVLVGAWVGWELAGVLWRLGMRDILGRLEHKIPEYDWLPDWDWNRMSPSQCNR